jgi:hypothetical protein
MGIEPPVEAIEVLGRMAGLFPDKEIASTLNMSGSQTGRGNAWTTVRVATLRCYHKLPGAFLRSAEIGIAHA